MDYSKYKSSIRRMTMHGAGIGGVAGAAAGALNAHEKNEDVRDKKKHGKNILHGALKGLGAGVAIGGIGANMLGRSWARNAERYRQAEDAATRAHFEREHRRSGKSGHWDDSEPIHKNRSSHPHHEHMSTLGISGNEKSKSEVKKKFREAAMKHHPDKGGDPAKMRKINEAYKHVQNTDWHEKLASFAKGFEKIAGMDVSQGSVKAPGIDPNKVKSMGFSKTFGNAASNNQTGLANLNTLGGLIPKGIF